jgi:hypothetical protein
LTGLHESLGQLVALKTLKLAGCVASTGLPESLSQLVALTTLDLSSCCELTGCSSRWAS